MRRKLIKRRILAGISDTPTYAALPLFFLHPPQSIPPRKIPNVSRNVEFLFCFGAPHTKMVSAA